MIQLQNVATMQNSKQAEPLAVRPSEAARIVGLGRTKCLELIYSGEIPSFTIGRARVVPIDGLRAWVAAQLAETHDTHS